MLKLKLKEARKRAGYTMKELAALLGITEGAVSNYENGKRQPDLMMLLKIADVFNCSTDYLLGRTDRPDAYLIEKEKLPVELADSGVKSVVKLGSAALSEEEVEAIRRLLAERPDLR